MLIEKEHLIKVGKIKKYYISKGYILPEFITKDFKLKVKSSDLSQGSEQKINFSCDKCGKISITTYKNYRKKFNTTLKLKKDTVDYCFKCTRSIYALKKDLNHFIVKSQFHHKNYYDYSKVEFKGVDYKVLIKCPIHKEFTQIAYEHMMGKGCNLCKVPSKGEKYIKEYLDTKNISYFYNHKFKDCKYIQPLRFDFYIPLNNLIIEFDGRQHTKATKFYGGEEALRITQIRDNIKNEYCKNNKITLLRISYKDYNKIEKILNNIIWE